VLKEELFCNIVDGLPDRCNVNTGNDNTNDVGLFEQPPMILLHGTEDRATPYVNGKAIYDRAQEVGVPSALITIEGGGHMIQNEIFENRFDEMTTSMYELMTMGAQAPAGCV